VIETHLRRIDAVNPALNAIVIRLDEQALAAADAADRAVAAALEDALGVITPLDPR
jgi:amidase